MTDNARNNKPKNAHNNTPDFRQTKETMYTMNTCVISILKQGNMSDFDDKVWDNLTLEWEEIGETIFTDDGWNFDT